MRDNLSIFVTMIVLVILVVIFPLYNHFERQDNMSYNLVLKATTNFVDEIMNSGYIDQDMYTKYVSQIANTGNLYDIQLEAHKKIITSDTELTDAFQDQYIVDYNEDIFETSTGKAKDSGLFDDKSIKNGVYKLDIGDEIYIKVKNSSTTMAEAMFKTIVPLASSKNITVNYGGIIKNNAWLKAESGVVAKELITLKFKIGAVVYEDWVSPKYLYNGESTVTFDINSANEKVILSGGEIFKGWIDEKQIDDEDPTLYSGDTIKVNKSMVLIPEIETPNPEVTLDSKGGVFESGVSSKIEVTYNEAYGELPEPTKEGYVFEGWYLESGDKITSDSTVTINKNHKLIAYWNGSEHNIIYELNGGTNNSENPSKYITGDTITLKKPTRTNYIFKGWYSDSSFTTAISTISGMDDKTVYAKWEIDSTIKPTAGSVSMKKTDGSTYTSTSWSNKSVIINFTSGVDTIVDIASSKCVIYNSKNEEVRTLNSGDSYTLSAEGEYTAKLETINSIGNSATSNVYIKIDKTAPVINVKRNPNNNKSSSFEYTITDNLSGINTKNLGYKSMGNNSTTTPGLGNFSFSNNIGDKSLSSTLNWQISNGDTYYIHSDITATDRAGNTAKYKKYIGPYTYKK